MNTKTEDKKFVFALDIGTRSVIGILGYWQENTFRIIDSEQAFHEKRAMRDGQIEDIDLVASVVKNVKAALEERSGMKFSRVSIAAAGRALKTAEASFTTQLIENDAINEKILQYMEYSAIEHAQRTFEEEKQDLGLVSNDYYCVGYSVKKYALDNYPIKNLLGQKGHEASVDIIAAFLPSSVLISLYAVTAACNLEVDNLTLEPIAAIHAVVPEDIRFLNIALVDVGGGTSDIAISKDGSIVAYDMVTTAGDEITEALMKHYLTNFKYAEDMKIAMSAGEDIEIKNILGVKTKLTADEIFETAKPAIETLAEAIAQRVLLINGSTPAAVFLVGGGSQTRELTKIVAEKMDLAEDRVALGLVSTDTGIFLFSDELLSPTYVTPIGIGIVSVLYRGCDFFSVKVNDKKIMLFNHQSIKAIDALIMAGIKPTSLVGLSAPNLVFTINGSRKVIKGGIGTPGSIEVNGTPATIETIVSQGDDIKVKLARNGEAPTVSILQLLGDIPICDVISVDINAKSYDAPSEKDLGELFVSFMDEIQIHVKTPNEPEEISEVGYEKPKVDLTSSTKNVKITKLYGDMEDLDKEDGSEEEIETDKAISDLNDLDESLGGIEDIKDEEKEAEILAIDVILNGKPTHLEQAAGKDEPFIVMHLLQFVDLNTEQKRGKLVIKVNDIDSGYATPIANGDRVVIVWLEEDDV